MEEHKVQWPPTMKPPVDFWVPPRDVTGIVPRDLQGSYFRLGPTWVRDGQHAIDTRGFLVRLVFADGAVRVTASLTESDSEGAEQAAGRQLFLRHGTPHADDGLVSLLSRFLRHRGWMEDPDRPTAPAQRRAGGRPRWYVAANTGLTMCGGGLLCLSPFGRPVSVDPRSLSSLGSELRLPARCSRFHFDALHPGGPRLITFAVEPARGGRQRSDLVIMELSPDGKLLHRQEHALGQNTVVYPGDFLVLRHFYVFHDTPYWTARHSGSRWRQPQVYLGYQPALSAARRTSDDGRLLFVPRARPGEPFGVGSGGLFVSAFGNVILDATEQNRVAFSAVCHADWRPSRPGNQRLYDPARYPGRLCALTVDTDKRTLDTRRMDNAIVEYPSSHPFRGCEPCRYTYARARPDDGVAPVPAEAAGPDFFSHVLKVDGVGQGRKAVRVDGSVDDVLFVPRAAAGGGDDEAEDEGWVIAQQRGPAGAEFAVYDATDLTRGPVCVIHLRRRLPPSVSSYFKHNARPRDDHAARL
eukprot:TRINITY_DN11769_c0_g1_i1.p1 TRINITY_DN11769_c0_g1~~TRINITY_DN11769_c0_g1_i1.p1  ORF type:complete len:525 (+),score=101.30 TRINITY_DN11769_c0_g1_i1:82-1656(+)